MKLKYIIVLLMILIVCVPTKVQADKTIRIYGNVTLDGEPIENLEIKIKNLDRGFEISTYTDSNGNYEGYTTSRDHENIRVETKYNQTTEYEEFEVLSNKIEYEVNFILSNGNGNDNENGNTVIIQLGLTWDCIIDWITHLTLINLIKILIIIFLILLILKLIFPKRKRVSTQSGMDNDTIILLPSAMNTKVRKF